MTNVTMDKRPTREQSPEGLSAEAFYTPSVDIWEDREGFGFLVDLPGVRTEDIDITYEGGVLTLSARVVDRTRAEQRPLLQEYRIGHFRRAFEVNAPIHSEGIKAELKNGELTLWVPKAESAKARKITVKST